MTLVSANLILKNEEKFILRCLTNIIDHVDEVVIVDTGSTDNTIPLIQEFSKDHSNIRLYHFDWVNDFSAARNFAKEKSLGKWIFFVDADEYLHPEDGWEIRHVCNLLADYEEVVVDVTYMNVANSKVFETFTEGVVRLFTKNLIFVEPIHEYTVSVSGRPVNRYTSDIRIYHEGFDGSMVDRVSKKRRNIAILEQRMKIDPKNGHNFMYFAREIRAINPELAVKYLNEAEYLFGDKITNGQKFIVDRTRAELTRLIGG